MHRALARCVALTVAVRAATAMVFPVEPSWDGHFYARLAEHLAAGHGYVEATARGLHPTAFWPPGLPLALAPVIALGASARVAAVIVNVVASAVACAAVYACAARDDARTARRAGLIYALAPGLALWSTATMTETLNGALLAVALLIALPRSAFGCGVGIGLAALVRPPSLLLITAAALQGPTPRDRAGALARCAMGAALVIAPWTARNARALDGPALISTNGGSNLLISATDPTGGYHRVMPAQDACTRAVGEVARDRCWRRAAVSAIAAHPLRWIARAPLRLARAFAIEADPAAHLRWGARPPPRGVILALGALCTLAWWALVTLSIRGRGADATTRVALLAGASLALTHAVFLGADRYHLALVPLLCPLAARGAR